MQDQGTLAVAEDDNSEQPVETPSSTEQKKVFVTRNYVWN